jgi:hypothetical protein
MASSGGKPNTCLTREHRTFLTDGEFLGLTQNGPPAVSRSTNWGILSGLPLIQFRLPIAIRRSNSSALNLALVSRMASPEE